MRYLITKPVHHANFYALADMCYTLNWGILVPEWDALGYGQNPEFLPEFNNVVMVSEKEKQKLRLGSFVLAACINQYDSAKALATDLNIPLGLMACNNRAPFNKSHANAILCEDWITYRETDIPNRFFMLPGPDYSIFKPKENGKRSGLVSGIENLVNRYPAEYALLEKVRKRFPVEEFTDLEWPYGVRDRLRSAEALIHLKPEEASGNLMMEALACGTPVITLNELINGRSCAFFLRPGLNCWGVNRHTILEDIEEAKPHLPYLQHNAAQSIRVNVPRDAAVAALEQFLNVVIK
jgi:hypothetical protein